MKNRCTYLGWDRLWLDVVAEKLGAMREELPGCVVVVPTAESGRRLREKLAQLGGCLAPRVVTPEAFFRVKKEREIATDMQEQWAWMSELLALKDVDAAGFEVIFPHAPAEQNFDWAYGVASSLRQVSNELGMSALSFADAQSAQNCLEIARWTALAQLQERVRNALVGWGLYSAAEAQINEATDGEIFANATRVIVAGVTDPVRLALRAWEKWEQRGIDVSIWVQAPEEERENFNDWGIPNGSWARRSTPLNNADMHVAASEKAFGEAVVAACEGWKNHDVSLALVDPTFAQAAEVALAEAGWKAWNPRGRVAGTAILTWFDALLTCARQPMDWGNYLTLMRHPLFPQLADVALWYETLALFDRWNERYLLNQPERFLEIAAYERDKGLDGELSAQKHERLVTAWNWLQARLAECREKSGSELVKLWIQLLHERTWDDGVEGKWLEEFAACGASLVVLERANLRGVDGLRLVCKMLPSLRSEEGRDEAAIDLLGWLEMNYASQKKTILLGFHEGCIPDRSLDDPFLSDAMRKELMLRNEESRMAEDSHRLRALAASSAVEILVAQVTPTGEMRRPSRLLLRETGETLVRRVRHLFAEQGDDLAALPRWERGKWHLQLDQKLSNYGKPMSPTSLREYLACPFRFYLKYVLGWRQFEPATGEMRSRDFGTILHAVLRNMAHDPDAKSTQNVHELRNYLWSELENEMTIAFGSVRSLELEYQGESAKERLAAFAEHEILQRAAGWTIYSVEHEVGVRGNPWKFCDHDFVMKIDRIDCRKVSENEYEYRVLDYKSSSKCETPIQAHQATQNAWRKAGRRDFFEGTEYETTEGDKESEKRGRWKNVQLPLYGEYAAESYGQNVPMIGYVNLPSVVNETKFQIWDSYDDVREPIQTWIANALDALSRGVFWPPAKLTAAERAYDPWDALAPEGLEAVVQGRLIEEMKAKVVDYEAWLVEKKACADALKDMNAGPDERSKETENEKQEGKEL